jgi:hypothetical protein
MVDTNVPSSALSRLIDDLRAQKAKIERAIQALEELRNSNIPSLKFLAEAEARTHKRPDAKTRLDPRS